jgi:hypothetical protein
MELGMISNGLIRNLKKAVVGSMKKKLALLSETARLKICAWVALAVNLGWLFVYAGQIIQLKELVNCSQRVEKGERELVEFENKMGIRRAIIKDGKLVKIIDGTRTR